MGYRGCDHQTGKIAIDYTYGVMFYAELQSYQVRCWNIRKPLNPDNIDVIFESDKLLFVVEVFIDSSGYLWFNTDHIPIDWATDIPLNLNEVNSRMFRVKVSDAIRGTINALNESDFSMPVEKVEFRRLTPLDDDNLFADTKTIEKVPSGDQLPFKQRRSVVTIEKSSEEKRIISVFYFTVDEKCDRVYFMDNGNLQYYQNTTYSIQKPSLWVIGLPSDGCKTRNFPIIRRSELPERISAKGSNGFMVVTPDYQSDSCEDVFFYIANLYYNYLVVYDYKNDEFWSFEHESFHPIIAESNFVFKSALNYYAPLGMFNVALGYPDENGDRLAYYSPIASTAQFAVSTKILKDKSKSSANLTQDDFELIGYRGSGHQTVGTVIDYTHGVMFYAESQSYQIRCWNIKKRLNPDNIDSKGYLWFNMNHIPVIWSTDIPLNVQEVNSRFFRVKVSDAIRGTVCEDKDKY
ncbi:L-dopachrome tautomerase yellow-f-like [Phlebotomus argentipes]|uniref:L-dopachrome tautomerase yellow-f-like n=1 Tax=Phlebotomus argentipes TaxID=94469 RepID=UPI00289341CE|nr:L-dopachrome tautomerase yellow-f-like [Phlebotomus argentipes]